MNNQTPPHAGTAFSRVTYLSGAEAMGQQMTAMSGKKGLEERVTSV
jgi:hypothetical protein